MKLQNSRIASVLFLIYFSCASGIYAQKITGPIVTKPVDFDISSPLRSLKIQVSPVKEQRKVEKAEQEIRNYFIKRQQRNKSDNAINTVHTQRYFGKIKPDTVLVNFEGTPNVSAVFPPDTYGDVGHDYYVQIVNLAFTVFNKSGNIVLGPIPTATLWSGLPHAGNSGDGIVLYDERADRWFISNLSLPSFPGPPYFVLIAVSQTSDPTGSWYRWEYEMDEIPDYPKFSVWRDAYYMTVNRFITPSNFDGIGAAAFDRVAMIAGDPSPAMIMFKFIHNQNVFGLLPADCDGPFSPAGTPGNFAYLDFNFLGLYEFHPDWAIPSNSTFGNLTKIGIDIYNGHAHGVPQKGTDVVLDPRSGSLMCRLQYRNFFDHQSMLVNQTVKVGEDQTGISWYELRKTAGPWSLYQQATYAPDSNSRWMGSIAMDSAGNIALGYSVSGYNLYPSIRYTGRMKRDPPGQMTIAEQSIIEGGGAQTRPASLFSRWGDYSSMTIDPSRPATFWYTQQYYPETADIAWHTRVGSFSFADILDIEAIAAYPNICRGQSDQLDVKVSGGNGNYSYFWSSIPAGFTSTLKNPVVSPDLTTKYFVEVSSGNKSRRDSITVAIIPPAFVDAGQDTTYCRLSTGIPLHGSAENYTSLKWSTSGDGLFGDLYSINTYYIPGIHDRKDSIIDLELIVYPQPPCPVISDHKLLRMDTCSGIPLIGSGNGGLSLYPNPGHNKVTITLPENAVQLEISDMTGRIIIAEKVESGSETEKIIDLAGNARGLYSVKVILKDRIITEKLVLE
jgi:hypothetical protein